MSNSKVLLKRDFTLWLKLCHARTETWGKWESQRDYSLGKSEYCDNDLEKSKMLDNVALKVSDLASNNTLRCATISFLLSCSVARIRLNSKRNVAVRYCTMYTLNPHGHKCLLIKTLMSIIVITAAYSEKPPPLSGICESPARFSSRAFRLSLSSTWTSSVVFVVAFPPDYLCLLPFF